MGAESDRPINYQFLADGLAFYTARGFDYIEVPWMVSEEVIRATLPKGAIPFSVGKNNFLVGSAEQSFVEFMMQKKKLGKHCAITPCFRDDAVDAWHQKYFMKLELFQPLPEEASEAEAQKVLTEMIDTALLFYGGYLPVRLEKTAEGTDIVSAENGIELGSYGIRRVKGVGAWVYGTGVAEPRLSSVIQSLRHETRRRA